MQAAPKLSNEALASVGLSIKPVPSAIDPRNRREWVLARARCLSAGLRLVLCEVDEIGIALRHDWITADRAAADLAALEQLPVHVASIFLSGANE